MSEPTKQAVLGLGDGNIDPDILTSEIDHDFFDNPSERVMEEAEKAAAANAAAIAACQQGGAHGLIFHNLLPNDSSDDDNVKPTSEGDCKSLSSTCSSISSNREPLRFDEENGSMEELEGAVGYQGSSGRSSSNNTVHLDLKKDLREAVSEDEGNGSEDFYSIQSNANYPRPKESYQMQQRRRSVGSIPQPQRGGGHVSRGDLFHPMNPSDCGLNGHLSDVGTDTSSSEDGVVENALSESDSDLTDSSESELESLDTDDEELVDMLEKYFDYIDPDSDCSDLTEVSPLSSMAASPLPNSFFPGIETEINHSQLEYNIDNTDFHGLNISTDMQLMEAANKLHITGPGEGNGVMDGNDEYEQEQEQESSGDIRLNSAVVADVAGCAVTAVASAVPAAAQFLERNLMRSIKPRLPTVISTTETIIIPADDDESDDDNNAPGSCSLSRAATCGTSIDIDDVEDADDLKTPEGSNAGERDPAKDKKELDVCFNCCIMEHAKKILSREASPSRRHRWLSAPKQDDEEGNGNNGENGNNADGGEQASGGTLKVRNTSWRGKLRASSSTSATSSASSAAASSGTNTFSTGSSGGASGSSGATGGSSRRVQRNYTFTPEQMRKIERENHVLLRKILDTHRKGHHAQGTHCQHHRCKNHGHHNSRAASSSIARLRQQKRIEQDNAILMKKLQSVKPSKEIEEAFGGKPGKN